MTFLRNLGQKTAFRGPTPVGMACSARRINHSERKAAPLESCLQKYICKQEYGRFDGCPDAESGGTDPMISDAGDAGRKGREQSVKQTKTTSIQNHLQNQITYVCRHHKPHGGKAGAAAWNAQRSLHRTDGKQPNRRASGWVK